MLKHLPLKRLADVGTLLPSTIVSSHWLQERTPRKEESVTQPSQAHHAQPYVAHSYVARGRQALHATAGRFARARWRRRGRRGQRMTREDGPTALHPPVYPLATTAFTPTTLGFLLPPMCSSQTPRSQGTTMQSQGTTELVGKGSLLRSPKRQSRGYTRDSGISAHGASAYVGIGIQAAKHVSLEPVKLTATVTTW